MIAISIMMVIMIKAILIKMVKIIVTLGLLMIKSHNDSTNHNDDSKGKNTMSFIT